MSDPSTRVGAAAGGLDRPVSREEIVLMELYDLTHQVNAGGHEVKPYPRPWPDPNARGRTDMTREQVLRVLREHGHHFDD